MKIRLFAISAILFSALLISGCSGSDRLAATSWPGLFATEDTVFVAYASSVHALNADSGVEKWRFPTEADRNISFFAPPALADDERQLIVAGYDNTIYSLNPQNGQPNGWQFGEAQNRFIAGVLATENGLYAASADHNLYALTLTGQPLWPEPFRTEEPQWARPAFDGEMLFLAGLDRRVHALDPQTGAERWATDLGASVGAPPLLSEGRLYVGTFGNEVVALDSGTGEVLWRSQTEDWVWSTPAIRDGSILVGDISGVFYILDAETGRETWRYTETDGGIFGQPLVKDDAFYFATENGKIFAFTGEHDIFWSFSIAGKVYGPLVANDDLILAATLEGDTLVTALNHAGVPRWTFTPEN